MTIHYLNCATLRPYWPRIKGGVTCLLVETNLGPVLVDTGFGRQDYQLPTFAVGFFMSLLRVPRDPYETAYEQVQQLGYEPAEIKHVVMTHLHLDHAGGLPDFPWAKVHLFQDEFEVTKNSHRSWEFVDYHWAHEPLWQPYQLTGDRWYGFEAIRLGPFEPQIWLVPLVGHSPGHCGVAIESDDGWLLHAGDAIPFNATFEGYPGWLVRWLLGHHEPQLSKLASDNPEVEIIGAHMDLEFYGRE